MPPYVAPGPPSRSFPKELRTPHEKRQRLAFLRRSVLQDAYILEVIERHLPTRYQKFALLDAVDARDGYVQLVRAGPVLLHTHPLFSRLVLRKIEPALVAQYSTLQTVQQRQSFIRVSINIDNPAHQQEMRRFLREIFDGTATLPGGIANRCSDCWRRMQAFHLDGTIRRCRACAERYFGSVKHTIESLDRRICGFFKLPPPWMSGSFKTNTAPFDYDPSFPVFFEPGTENELALNIHEVEWKDLLAIPLATLKRNWVKYCLEKTISHAAAIHSFHFQNHLAKEPRYPDPYGLRVALHQANGSDIDLFCPLDAYGIWSAGFEDLKKFFARRICQNDEVKKLRSFLRAASDQDFESRLVPRTVRMRLDPLDQLETVMRDQFRPCLGVYAEMVLDATVRPAPYGGVVLDWCNDNALPTGQPCLHDDCDGLQPPFSLVEQAFISQAHATEQDAQAHDIWQRVAQVLSRFRIVLASMIQREAMAIYQDNKEQPWREWIELVCGEAVVNNEGNFTTLGEQVRNSAPFDQDYQNLEAWSMGRNVAQRVRFMVHVGAEEFWRTFMRSPMFLRLAKTYLKEKQVLILVPNTNLSNSGYVPGWIIDAWKLLDIKVNGGTFDAGMLMFKGVWESPSKRIAVIKWSFHDIPESANSARGRERVPVTERIDTVCMKDLYDNSAEPPLEGRTKAI
ncbi:uncharacterized protein MYCFIDRAFT_85502 [Pseudocercospora fijiensis CIRAD86]|uniref:Uncharacterized protein n=1 Tax=Pseudocercospora fijiensis (strain CIRAD86) TaxID=383855 RepID=M3B2S2_PSEFD|nr:uncharacterized protein MYCFIDRAFT_85502 [Pseudocercospora fijiensis CIRAD86]EME83663.1 hypothetical protein MYCFIDRAFT_85502 [Pseudocercospora fijiensis CIRAD86]